MILKNAREFWLPSSSWTFFVNFSAKLAIFLFSFLNATKCVVYKSKKRSAQRGRSLVRTTRSRWNPVLFFTFPINGKVKMKELLDNKNKQIKYNTLEKESEFSHHTKNQQQQQQGWTNEHRLLFPVLALLFAAVYIEATRRKGRRELYRSVLSASSTRNYPQVGRIFVIC